MNIEFYVVGYECNWLGDHGRQQIWYYINIECGILYPSDYEISELLDIEYEEYTSLMVNHGAIQEHLGFVFLYENEAQKFADFLNDRYLVLLRLRGKL